MSGVPFVVTRLLSALPIGLRRLGTAYSMWGCRLHREGGSGGSLKNKQSEGVAESSINEGAYHETKECGS